MVTMHWIMVLIRAQLFFKKKDYDDDSYFCLMAVRSSDADDAVYKRIVELFQSETTKQIFQDEFNGYFVPAWEVQK